MKFNSYIILHMTFSTRSKTNAYLLTFNLKLAPSSNLTSRKVNRRLYKRHLPEANALLVFELKKTTLM